MHLRNRKTTAHKGFGVLPAEPEPKANSDTGCASRKINTTIPSPRSRPSGGACSGLSPPWRG